MTHETASTAESAAVQSGPDGWPSSDTVRQGPLRDLRVLDCATLFAGPLVATHMADFGADVIKVEHPRGDALRATGLARDGVGLWWKVVGRNKRCITLDLHAERGRELLLRLAADADVLIENFRPDVMERWGLGWDVLSEINPRLVMVRTTGFGHDGPYSSRVGFGTLAEAMSGFAHITGQPDGPPTLPPFGLADSIAALQGTAAVMFALHERDRSGRGQWIDLAILEPMIAALGYQATAYDQLGVIQQRFGNRSRNNAPRNTYRTADDRWVAISCSTPSIVNRVLRLVGGDDLADDPRFATAEGRVAAVEELDAAVGGWIEQRPLDDVVAAFEAADAAVAPVYDVEQLLNDPHVQARGAFVPVMDDELGSVTMQDVTPRLSRTPGGIRQAGQPLASANVEVYHQLGLDDETLARLRDDGVI